MNYTEVISNLIDDEIKLSILTEDKDSLRSIQNKLLSNENLSYEDKSLIIEKVLSQKLDFDMNGNPIGNTLVIEKLIDFINSK